MTFSTLILLALAASSNGVRVEERRTSLQTQAAANPIRKVVTMLQQMQKKVEAEGELEKELYEKFMCYCSNGGKDLEASIDAAGTKIPQVTADIKSAEEQSAQQKDALKEAQSDRAAAEASMKEATAIREKEAAAFAALKAEADANIAALTKATAAIEKGAGGSFLQTSAASVLQKLAGAIEDESDKQQIMSFLSGGAQAPSDQIIGILKQMGDTMNEDLADATAEEEAALKKFNELVSIKTKEVDALTNSIEAKITSIGELGVKIVEMKEDLDDTSKGLEEDTKFLDDLEKSCKTKTAEWDERVKTRGEELAALADTVKILNDDDALELFKKTLPGAGSSFVQVSVSTTAMRAQAMAAIRQAKGPHRAQMDFVLLALRGKTSGFEKVLSMIDAMTALLKEEGADDDNKKEYCEKQFDQTEDKQKALDRKLSDEQAAIASAEESISTLIEEMKALEAGIVALDKSVAEATTDRQQENTEYKQLQASDTAAKEILKFAKNRLNKFYNPKLYQPPAKKELSAEDRIVENMGSASLMQDAPPPPPETFGAYKKSGKSTGVIAMIDLLIGELDTELTEAKQEEKDAQADYESMMKDSAEKRTLDSKALSDKGATKADTEAELESTKGSRKETLRESYATHEYTKSLHVECDWLLTSYDARKEARTGEIDSLTKAKAILSGADYSLLQKSRHLRSSK